MSRSSPIPQWILDRKGARTKRDVPAEVRALLDAGAIETANLCEWLIVDQRQLAETVLQDHRWREHWPPLRAALDALPRPTAPLRMATIGRALGACFPGARDFRSAQRQLAAHRSDVVRSWSCFLVGARQSLSLGEKLKLVRPLADDSNPGVRETAWLALRDAISAELESAIELLAAWAEAPSPNVRRFASESTRPRGVWCRHIDRLKSEPQVALPILEPLKADSAKYVQDSVGNWLNDASKSQPTWVRALAARWRRESRAPGTGRIVQRALRTLSK